MEDDRGAGLSSAGFCAGFGLTTGAGEVGAAVVGAVGVAEVAGDVGLARTGRHRRGRQAAGNPIVGAVGGGTGIERPMAGRAVKAGGGTTGGCPRRCRRGVHRRLGGGAGRRAGGRARGGGGRLARRRGPCSGRPARPRRSRTRWPTGARPGRRTRSPRAPRAHRLQGACRGRSPPRPPPP